MSNNGKNNPGLGGNFKSLIVASIRLVAIIVGFLCRVTIMVLTGITSLTDKLSGNDSSHH